ncbi:hypothetical protein [Streptomyces otsuchiensis]|uniref:hypothetical protein n=1 Tax=Streptomyces otsuchiensis TaxID=2681388 RepID=UPI001030ACBB|nr:hypothetical protein [Streptomyces otsuchiensis]
MAVAEARCVVHGAGYGSADVGQVIIVVVFVIAMVVLVLVGGAAQDVAVCLAAASGSAATVIGLGRPRRGGQLSSGRPDSAG